MMGLWIVLVLLLVQMSPCLLLLPGRGDPLPAGPGLRAHRAGGWWEKGVGSRSVWGSQGNSLHRVRGGDCKEAWDGRGLSADWKAGQEAEVQVDEYCEELDATMEAMGLDTPYKKRHVGQQTRTFAKQTTPSSKRGSEASGAGKAETTREAGAGNSGSPPSQDSADDSAADARDPQPDGGEADDAVVTKIAGIPYWMEAPTPRPLKRRYGAKRGWEAQREDGDAGEEGAAGGGAKGGWSLWDALVFPERISKATWKKEQAAIARGEGKGPPPPADLMDLTLFPLALLPGNLGRATRGRIVEALSMACRDALRWASWAVSLLRGLLIGSP